MLFGEKEDYWSQGITEDFKEFNPFLHLWSLGVEEQFYIIFPFIVLTSKLLCVPFVGILLAMAVSSLVFGFWLSHAARTSAAWGMYSFYLLPARFWELALGCLLVPFSRSFKDLLSGHKNLLKALEIISVVLLAAALVCTANDPALFPLPYGFVAVFGALLVIFVGATDPNALLTRTLSSKLLVFVGRLSYSLYLWHLPVLALSTWMLPEEQRGIASHFGTALLMVLLALGSFFFLEDPLRKLRVASSHALLLGVFATAVVGLYIVFLSWKKSWKPLHCYLTEDGSSKVLLSFLKVTRITIEVLAAASLLISAITRSVLRRQVSLQLLIWLLLIVAGCEITVSTIDRDEHNWFDRASKYRVPAVHGVEGSCDCRISETSGQLHEPPGSTKENGSRNAPKLPVCFSDMDPSLSGFRATESYNCNARAWANSSLEDLVAKCWPREARQAIYVVGDSHASRLAATFAAATHIPTHALTWYRYQAEEFSPKTLAALNLVLKEMDVVAFAVIQVFEKDVAELSSMLKKYLAELYKIVHSRKAKLLLIGGNPQMQGDATMCFLKQKSTQACGSNLASKKSSRPELMTMYEYMKKPDVYFFDTYDFFCDRAGACPIFIPGSRTVAYWDDNHLSDPSSFYLAPFLCSFFKKSGIAPAGLNWPAGAWR